MVMFEVRKSRKEGTRTMYLSSVEKEASEYLRDMLDGYLRRGIPVERLAPNDYEIMTNEGYVRIYIRER